MKRTSRILFFAAVSFLTKTSNAMELNAAQSTRSTPTYGICLLLTIPMVEVAQNMNEMFRKEYPAIETIIPHITLLQMTLTPDQLPSIKSLLSDYSKAKGPFEITMAPQIVAAGNNNTFWDVKQATDSWKIVQEMHTYLKQELSMRLNQEMEIIKNNDSEYRPHCTVAYNIQNQSLNDKATQELLPNQSRLNCMLFTIALAELNQQGNIAKIIGRFNFPESPESQKQFDQSLSNFYLGLPR